MDCWTIVLYMCGSCFSNINKRDFERATLSLIINNLVYGLRIHSIQFHFLSFSKPHVSERSPCGFKIVHKICCDIDTSTRLL